MKGTYLRTITLSLALLSVPFFASAEWVEPSCNPDDPGGPTAEECRVSAPLNVSALYQQKSGVLRIQNAMQAAQLQINQSYGTGNGDVSIVTSNSSTDAVTITNNGTGYAVRAQSLQSSSGAGGVYASALNANAIYGTAQNAAGVYGTSANSHGVEGYSPAQHGVHGYSDNQAGVYGESGNNVGIYGTSTQNAGVMGESEQNHGVLARSTQNAALRAEGPTGAIIVGTDSGGGASPALQVESDDGVALNVLASGDGVGVNIGAANNIGLFANSSTQAGVFASSNGNGQSGVYAQGLGTNGFGVYGVAPSGVGIYGVGGQYAGQFAGNTLTEGRATIQGAALAANFIQTQRKTDPLQEAAITNDGVYVTDEISGLRNMVFDGAEVWIMTVASSSQSRVYRYGASDMLLSREIQYNWSGTPSELVQAANPSGRGVYFWNPSGEVYYWERNTTDPVQLTGSGDPRVPNATAGIDAGHRVYIGTSDGSGVYYSTTLKEEDASSFVRVGNGQSSWANVVDMEMDHSGRVYILNQQSSGSSQLLRIGDNATSVDKKYDLPSGQSPKHMVYDGTYMWIAVDGSGTDRIVRVDVENDTVEEFYLTDNGQSGGNIECNSPRGVEYDGVFVWVSCYGGSTSTRGYVRVRTSDGALVRYDTQSYRLRSQSGYPLHSMMFDGTYMWSATTTDRLVKYYSGHGDGSYGEPFAVGGMNIISVGGNVYCLFVTDQSDGKGSLFLGARGEECQNVTVQ